MDKSHEMGINSMNSTNSKGIFKSPKKKGTKKEVIDLRKFPRDQIKVMKPKNYLVDPFKKFKINDSRFLNDLDNRSHCKKCNKSRKYFCYNCYIPVKEIENRTPKVNVSHSFFILFVR